MNTALRMRTVPVDFVLLCVMTDQQSIEAKHELSEMNRTTFPLDIVFKAKLLTTHNQLQRFTSR